MGCRSKLRAPFQRVWGHAEEGHKHGIPTCCGIRFGLTWERPKVSWYLPHPFLRPWVRLVTVALPLAPRRAFALYYGHGYVPCEYHLVRWVLTGRRPDIMQDEPLEHA